MSVKWIDYVIKESPYSGPTFAVHMILANRMNLDEECWPKQETIAEEARVSIRSVERAIKTMCDDGYLVRWRKGYRHFYRLLVSNGPATQAGLTRHTGGSDPTDRRVQPVTQAGAYRTVSEPSVEPSEEPTTPAPSGLGKDRTAMRGTAGAFEDDSEMLEYGQKPERKKDRFESVPRENTQPWAIYQWELEMVNAKCGRDYLVGALRRTIKNLHEDGYSYDEIVLMIQTFWVRYAQDVRAKRGEIDPAIMFSTRLGQLKKQAEPTMRGMASGETAVDRGKAEREEFMKSMRRKVEQ